MPRASASRITDDDIRVHAYYLWEQDGRPSGRDADFWLRAASELGPKPRAKRAAAPRKARGKA